MVGNPYSGAKDNRRIVVSLGDALRQRQLAFEEIWDPDERRRRFADADWMANVRAVVVAGGDGTIAAVFNEFQARPWPAVAIYPLGNENLLAQEFGFNGDAGALADAIERGRCRALDIGVANGTRFSLMVGVGLDADVVHRLTHWRERGEAMRRVKRATYIRPITEALVRYAYPTITLETDDGQAVVGRQVLVVNVARYGMDLAFAPNAKGDDGALNWVVFEKPGRWRQVRYLLSVWRGKHLNRADVHSGTAKRIRLTAERPAPVQLDGDMAGYTPVDIRIEPHAVTLIDMAAAPGTMSSPAPMQHR